MLNIKDNSNIVTEKNKGKGTLIKWQNKKISKRKKPKINTKLRKHYIT